MQFDIRDPKGQARSEVCFLSRQQSYFEHYIAWLDEARPTSPFARVVSIIARSPASPVMSAMRAAAGDLHARQVQVRTIFSNLDPEMALRSMWEAISTLAPERAHTELVRWANAPALLEAHEQMVLGEQMNWLGDAMRREPGRRDGFDIFEPDATHNCCLALKSYAAMWKHAQPVPKWLLSDDRDDRQGASSAGPDPRTFATVSVFHKLEKPDILRN